MRLFLPDVLSRDRLSDLRRVVVLPIAQHQLPQLRPRVNFLERVLRFSDRYEVRALWRVGGTGYENVRISPQENGTVAITDGSPPRRQINWVWLLFGNAKSPEKSGDFERARSDHGRKMPGYREEDAISPVFGVPFLIFSARRR
jgi:hypothetical protein